MLGGTRKAIPPIKTFDARFAPFVLNWDNPHSGSPDSAHGQALIRRGEESGIPMNHLLTSEQRRDFARRGFSRRMFGRLAALAGAGAALPFYSEPVLAQLSTFTRIPPGAVRLNANENPLGPCPEALEAIQAVARNGGRYLFEMTWDLAESLAAQTGLKREYVEVYGGSSDPLHHTVLAFCSPTRPFVVA